MRIEQTLEENRSHQSQGMLRGIRDCMVLTEYSACTISRIHLFDDKFPTVGVHNLTNALGLRLAESGSKLLIVNAFKQLTLSLYAYWKERTQELVWIWKLNSSSLGASSPGALAAMHGGGVGRGGGLVLGVWRRRACNLRLWNLNSTSNSLCGSPLTELSNFRQSARSRKEREWEQTLINRC